jgi:O-antigen ligase
MEGGRVRQWTGLLLGSVLAFAILNGGSYTARSWFLLAALLGTLAPLLVRVRISSEWHPGLTLPLVVTGGLSVLSGTVALWAVNPEGAVEVFFRYLAALVLSLLLTCLSQDGEGVLFKTLYFSVAGTAGLSLLAACGLALPGWYGPEPGSDLLRIAGPFRYANTTGAVMAALWLAGARLYVTDAPEPRTRHLFDLLQTLLVASLLLTFSRGTFLALLLGIVYLAIAVGLRKVWSTFGRSLVWGCLVGAVVSVYKFPGLAATLPALALLTPPSERVCARHPVLARMRPVIGGAVLIAALLTWDAFGTRVGTISPGTHTARDRLAYWQTAFEILKHNRWGIGGGGWPDLYPQYQTFAFWTNEVHNSYLAATLETGIVGGALLGAVLLGFGYTLLRRVTSERAPEAGACLVLLGHAALDFDWSFLGAWLLTVYFLAVSTGGTGNIRLPRWLRWAILPVALGAWVQYAAEILEAEGANGLRVNPVRAEKALAVALRLDPLSADAHLALAHAVLVRAERETEGAPIIRACAVRYLGRGAALRPRSAEVQYRIGRLLVQTGNAEAAWPYLWRAVALAPYRQECYVAAAGAAFLTGERCLHSDPQSAERWFRECVALHQAMQARAAAQPSWPRERERMPSHNPHLDLIAGKALFYLGDYAQAVVTLDAAAQDPVLRRAATEWKSRASSAARRG